MRDLKSFGAVAAVCLLLAGLAWSAFGQARHYPFVDYDDPEYVYGVPEIAHGLTRQDIAWAFTNAPAPNWYPLTNISHMIEAQLFGMNPSRFHLTNIFLHTLGAILLFLMLQQATGALWRAAFVAAIFTVHPLRVESVVWITERKDVLSGIFFMLTLAAYVRFGQRKKIGWYFVSLFCLGCGLMSKPMLVTTPLILLLLDWWPLKRGADWKSWRRLLFEKIPFLLLSLGSTALTISAQTTAERSIERVDWMNRFWNAAFGLVIYLKQMIWPADLAVFYPRPMSLPAPVVLGSIFLCLAITVLTLTNIKTRPYLLVGWFWNAIMLAPVLGIVQAGLQGHADRFTYLPQIGIYIAMTWLAADLVRRLRVNRTVVGIVAAACLAVLVSIARAQTTTWRDSESLWLQAIVAVPDNAFAHASLADVLLRRGRVDESIDHSEQALKIAPSDADAHNNLGLALLQKGRETEAIEQFEEALRINPSHMNAAPNLAWILATSADAKRRDGSRAVLLSETVLQHAGHPNAIVLRTLAAAYAEAGRFPDAVHAATMARHLALAEGNEGLAADLSRAIANYENGRPLRSSPAPQN